ncbi:sensor histidine kinase [Streptomyces fuscichromogenes]|uniref:Signal transduction histidine kinase subgroup 3 dimerisation and phosphoacceptor domain-containing protein n=1 Tax=Streptomyces fuscichromogenes TaxID=1324013 RepID=A0A918CSQ7_9ACTN|nr:histidine kinase [Streptomyces fuscichromogenes]GGN19611.1 hypothetical protein GCM10011578_049610 [Streptomyces fuscichromogenes]
MASQATPLTWVFIVLYLAQTAVATMTLASLRQPRNRILVGVTVACAADLGYLVWDGVHIARLSPESTAFAASVIMIPLASVWAATPRWAYSAVAAAACFACAAISPAVWRVGLLACAAVWASVLLGVHSSLWSLNIMRRLDAARETQANLAVAEERLRIARDLHDVLGRNLAIVAFKGELAARLTGGIPQVQSELEEIQRLVRESQQEVHTVVNGYRTADLATELDGATAVLRSAGIACRVHRDVPEDRITPDAQAALGWVIREGITNVIRHSQARTCTIRLVSDPSQLVISVTNDQVLHTGTSGGGTGLSGLTQRISSLGGSLTHGPGPKNTFRLIATLPHDSKD